jgi:hypothetical protein
MNAQLFQSIRFFIENLLKIKEVYSHAFAMER